LTRPPASSSKRHRRADAPGPQDIQAILETAGSSLDRVVKCGVFLQDMADFQAMNTVYADSFRRQEPPRAPQFRRRLPLGALVEIDAIALLK